MNKFFRICIPFICMVALLLFFVSLASGVQNLTMMHVKKNISYRNFYHNMLSSCITGLIFWYHRKALNAPQSIDERTLYFYWMRSLMLIATFVSLSFLGIQLIDVFTMPNFSLRLEGILFDGSFAFLCLIYFFNCRKYVRLYEQNLTNKKIYK